MKKEILELLNNGVINSLQLTKKTYSVRGLICKDYSTTFKKATDKNILSVLSFLKSFNSTKIDINCNNYILESNKNKTNYCLMVDNKVKLNISVDTDKRIIIDRLIINESILRN